ncbi:MAG: SPOR domain-containing protein [Saprospiraceae bacterium]|jgi:cell division septation protein DedD|nr:SPOR domain-containing protein [Saprospiraceae bacterium]
MSRVDYLTIGIVGVCLAALGFLVFKTVKLMSNDAPPEETLIETPYEDTTGIGAYSDYGDTSLSSYTKEEDLDDDQLAATDYEEEPTKETTKSAKPATKETKTATKSATTTKSEPKPAASQRDEGNEEPAASRSTSSSEGNYLVIAGSFKSKTNAENQVKRLHKLGYNDASVESFNNGALAVALVDRFSSQLDAQALKQELEAKGVEAIVKKKQ